MQGGAARLMGVQALYGCPLVLAHRIYTRPRRPSVSIGIFQTVIRRPAWLRSILQVLVSLRFHQQPVTVHQHIHLARKRLRPPKNDEALSQCPIPASMTTKTPLRLHLLLSSQTRTPSAPTPQAAVQHSHLGLSPLSPPQATEIATPPRPSQTTAKSTHAACQPRLRTRGCSIGRRVGLRTARVRWIAYRLYRLSPHCMQCRVRARYGKSFRPGMI